ncbi:hypothetical protein MSG28_015531 [Choristoneura fumiferana]|uniref:Uncharacterized protein n=1 Tax=Choristoneura fumiferana TaxID=7141 RepID=A0ACC0KAM9_CHOFU|nr:hypothetical protein MSG28_015531 [Choristoneura fumiferana]
MVRLKFPIRTGPAWELWPKPSCSERRPVPSSGTKTIIAKKNAPQETWQKWRYATGTERLATCLGVASSFLCSCGLVLAVLIYGELTALLVARHRAVRALPPALLAAFGGGRSVYVPEHPTSPHQLQPRLYDFFDPSI